jgi:hypothetical protein
MGDGLDSLTAMRAKSTSRRAVPPPRHQPRSTPVDMPTRAGETTEPAPVRKPATSTAKNLAASTDLTRVSIYLDEPTDTYLETVRAAARSTRPRVDATRSAVVRLALNRLASQLDAAAVVAELQRNAAGHTGPGRKRA